MNDIPASQDMASQHSPSVDEQIALEATPPQEAMLTDIKERLRAEFKALDVFYVDHLHELEAAFEKLWVKIESEFHPKIVVTPPMTNV